MFTNPMKPPIKAEYLGYGVYVEFDGYQLRLYTIEGDYIALDFETYNKVRAYGSRIWELKP